MAKKPAFREKLKDATETSRARILKFEEEAQKLVHKVVEKGRDAQVEGKKRWDDIRDKAPPILDRVRDVDLYRRVQAFRDDVEHRFEGGMDRLLETLGVASRAEIEKLSKRLDSLTRKVGAIAKEKAQPPAAVKKARPAAKTPTVAKATRTTKASKTTRAKKPVARRKTPKV